MCLRLLWPLHVGRRERVLWTVAVMEGRAAIMHAQACVYGACRRVAWLRQGSGGGGSSIAVDASMNAHATHTTILQPVACTLVL